MLEVLGHGGFNVITWLLCQPLPGTCLGSFRRQEVFYPGKPMEMSFTSFVTWRMTNEPHYWPENREIPAHHKPPEWVIGDDFNMALMWKFLNPNGFAAAWAYRLTCIILFWNKF